MDRAAAEAPYSEMTLNLEKGVWENRFPKGKEGLWGEPTGPAKAPAFPGSYYAFSLKDVEGNTRPYLGAGYYNQMWNWGNYAFDSDRGRLVVYWTLPQQTAEYDPRRRTWQSIVSAEKVPREFNEAMYFGAMCYDPINKEVLGGQGGWVYAGCKWRKLQLGSPLLERLRGKAEAAPHTGAEPGRRRPSAVLRRRERTRGKGPARPVRRRPGPGCRRTGRGDDGSRGGGRHAAEDPIAMGQRALGHCCRHRQGGREFAGKAGARGHSPG